MTAPIKGPLEAIGADTGMPVYLGRIAAGATSQTNGQTADAFNTTGDGLAGKNILVLNAGTVEVSVYPVTSSTGTTTRTYAAAASYGVPIPAGESRTIRMGSGATHLATITDSAAANVDVWEMV